MSERTKKTIISAATGTVSLVGAALLRYLLAVGWGGRWLLFVVFAVVLCCIATFLVVAFEPFVRRLGRYAAGLYRGLKGLSKVEQLIASVGGMRKELERIVEALTPAMVWKLQLSEPGPAQQMALQTVKTIVSSLVIGSEPGREVTDAGLAEIMNYLAREHLAGSDNQEIRRHVFLIRNEGYGLDDGKFGGTRQALRASAANMLKNEKSPLRTRVHAYNEIMAHADQWAFAQLRELEATLKTIRRSDGFEGVAREDEFGINMPSVFGAAVSHAHHNLRLWKRVWAGTGNGWGTVACAEHNGTGCESHPVLTEVSLRGASCRTCMLQIDMNERKVMLTLPSPDGLVSITVNRAVLKAHLGHFDGNGKRERGGFGLEFIDIAPEDLAKLGRFIRSRTELDPEHPPEKAPWGGAARTGTAPWLGGKSKTGGGKGG